MQSTLDIPYSESRNRVTVLVRIILVIPHLVVYYVLNIAADRSPTFADWFIQVFTGKRNPGIAGFVSKVIAYQARILGYSGLLFDEYPGFFDDQGKTPARIACRTRRVRSTDSRSRSGSSGRSRPRSSPP